MFHLLYFAVAWLLWLPAVLILAFLLPFKPKIRSIFLRRFLLPSAPFKERGIWLHFASFGEARAVKPIVDQLPSDQPLNITTATKTGFDEAKRLYPQATVKLLPFENFLPFWVSRQRALIVFDAELWYLLFKTARQKGTKTALFNARISAKSQKSYEKLGFFYKQIFSQIDFIFTQNESDQLLIKALNAPNVAHLGNIKLLNTPLISHIFAKPDALVTTLASTHESEEALMIEAWQKSAIGGKLIIAPRHPERFDEVSALPNVARFSKTGNFDAEITLVDRLGVLNEIYAISDIVILGGSFVDRGGHNPLEPISLGARLISGKFVSNQKALFAVTSGVIFADQTSLATELQNILTKPKPAIAHTLTTTKLKEAIDVVLQD